MWTRSELKTRAKAALKGTFVISALLVFLYLLLTGGKSSNITFNFGQEATTQIPGYTENLSNDQLRFNVFDRIVTYPFSLLTALFGASAFLLSILWSIFIAGPLEMGISRYFSLNREDARENGISSLFYAFKSEHYLNNVTVAFMRNLFQFLWALLLIIPGIIKSFAYFFTPWIMAEYPDTKYQEALALSTKMTDGHKWDIFVLELSFIGWYLLAIPTLGVATPFVSAYRYATMAELYDVLKQGAL